MYMYALHIITSCLCWHFSVHYTCVEELGGYYFVPFVCMHNGCWHANAKHHSARQIILHRISAIVCMYVSVMHLRKVNLVYFTATRRV